MVISTPLVIEDKVYFTSANYYVYCLDLETGKLVWKNMTGDEVWSSPNFFGNNIVFGCLNGKVYCVDKDTGKEKWTFRSGSSIYASPGISDEYIFIGNNEGKFYCIDGSNGKSVWIFDANGSIWRCSPSIFDDKVFFGTRKNGMFYALSVNDGSKIWERALGDEIWSSPSVTKDGYIYIGAGNKFYCLKVSTGEIVWEQEFKDRVDSSPAVSGDLVYFGSHDGYLYCYDRYKGKEVWSKKLGRSIDSSPAISNSYLVISNFNHEIFGLKQEEKPEIELSKDRIDFGRITKGETRKDSVLVTNKGGGELRGKVMVECNWIEVSPEIFKGNSITLNIEVKTENLFPEKEYSGYVIVDSNGGKKQILVTFYLEDKKPNLSVSVESIDFGEVTIGEEKTLKFKIINDGGGKLSGEIKCDDLWIKINPKQFNTNILTVEITIVTDNLKVDKEYNSVIKIISNGGEKEIPVTVKVKDKPPVIWLSREIFDFGNIYKGETYSQVLVIKNKGGGELKGYINHLVYPWLYVSTSNINGNYNEVTLTIKTESLDVGKYSGYIYIKTNGGERKIEINFEVIKKTVEITLRIGESVAYINNEIQFLDSPPYIKNGRTMVPLRFIAEAFGSEVFWEPETKTVRIVYEE